jgi:hypothetical protein
MINREEECERKWKGKRKENPKRNSNINLCKIERKMGKKHAWGVPGKYSIVVGMLLL